MSHIKIKRGPEANRQSYTPQNGELLITTGNTRQLFVGDGVTAGGVEVVPSAVADTTALPIVSGQGRVNVGNPVWSGKTWAGLKMWYRTIRGYMPNSGSDMNNVNGVATANLFGIGSGFVVSQKGWVDRPGPGQTQLLQAGGGLGTDASHLALIYTVGAAASTNKQVRLFNDHGNGDYNGAQFLMVIEYTDSNNP